MKIIIEKNKNALSELILNIKNVEKTFMSMYGRYLEDYEKELVKDVIHNRTYYIAISAGEKNINGNKFSIEKNSYKIEDYKFIDTRVYSLNDEFVIINLSNITNIQDSISSLICSLMHEILHTTSNRKLQMYV